MMAAPGVALSAQAGGATNLGENVLLKVGYFAFCLYLFAFYSRFLDVSPSVAQLHLPAACLIIAMLAAVLSGRMGRLFHQRIAIFSGRAKCLPGRLHSRGLLARWELPCTYRPVDSRNGGVPCRRSDCRYARTSNT